jgi:hypothetical protein
VDSATLTPPRLKPRRSEVPVGSKAIGPANGPSSASRLEQYLADLNRLVGDEASRAWEEDPVVEIRVAVGDGTGVPGLVRRLARVFDRSAISFDRSRNEVQVESEWESRAVVAVVDAVEAWLEEADLDSTTLSIGDRSYTLAGSTPLAASQ